MPLRLIEIAAPASDIGLVQSIAEQFEAIDVRTFPAAPDGTQTCQILARAAHQQDLLDRLEAVLDKHPSWRLMILAVEATIPEPEKSPEKERSPEQATREELYSAIHRGARLDRTYVLLVLLSTIVAVIGLLQNEVAIVIGAMLIAPLLGPNMAMGFGAVLGDTDLILHAAATNAAGIGLSVGVAVVVGLVVHHPQIGDQMLSRTVLGYDNVLLALASGTAGALSLATNLPSALVGVMAAVALLPPAATFGFLLGAGRFGEAGGAGALLVVNIISVNLASELVFLAHGMRPRTWLERRNAQQSTRISIVLSTVLLTAMVAVIFWWRSF